MLTPIDIDNKLKNNKYKSDLETARKLQKMNQIYTVPFHEYKVCNSEYRNLLERCYERIGNDRAYNNFINSINYPLSVNTFVNDSLFKPLSKIWQGEGYYIQRTPSDKDHSHTPSFSFYTDIFWNRYITNPNDLMVFNIVDGNLDWHFLDIQDVEYLDFKKHKGEYFLTDVIFKIDKNTFAFVNDKSWGKFERDGGVKIIEQSDHNLGFIPALFVSNQYYNQSPVIRKNNITDSLGDLEELFIVNTLRNVVDKHIAPYTISANTSGCDYDDGSIYCDEGYLKTRVLPDGVSGDLSSVSVTDMKGSPRRCPQCNDKPLGFGSIAEIRSTGLDADAIASLIQNAVNYVALDESALTYPSTRNTELETKIKNRVIGKTEEYNARQQHNELRIMSTYEDRLDVIFETKQVAETFISSADTKAMKIRYNNYKETVVNLGTDFYLASEAEYQQAIEQGNKNRIEGYIDNKRGLVEVKYKNNENKRNREVTILYLEKIFVQYPYLDNNELINLLNNELSLFTAKDFWINQNFYNIICQIESENDEGLSIHEILDGKTYQEKYNFINQYINTKWQQMENTTQ